MLRLPSAAAAGAVLIAAAAGISGCAPLPAVGLGQSAVTWNYTSTVPVSSLIVNDTAGSVSVSSGPGSGVSVTATIYYYTSKPSITHTISGRALTLGYSACSGCGVRFTVTVPASASVAIHQQTGSVTVASLAGDVSVQNHIGSINGTGLTAPRASFQNGTGNIDVAFTGAPRQLSAISRTGRVSVSVPPGTTYQVNASSKVGVVKVSVPQSPATAHVITAAVTIGMVSVSNN